MRYLWIDAWRGILIILVVLGHAVGGAEHFSPIPHAGPLDYVYRLIYGFHMPAFFFLAGMLWRPCKIDFISFVRKKFYRLMVPYIIWGCISIVVFMILSEMFANTVVAATSSRYVDAGYRTWWEPFLSLLHAGGWPNGTGFRANSVLWFFPCIFSTQVCYYLIDKYFKSSFSQIIVLFVIVILYGIFILVDKGLILPWGLKRMMEFMPYFILGRWLSDSKFVHQEKKFVWGNWLQLSVIIILYALLTILRLNGVSSKLWFCVGYAVGIIKALLGIFISIKFVNLISVNLMKKISVIGMSSLGIMVVHKWFVLAVEMKCIPIRNLFSQGFGVAMIGVLITTIITSVLSLFVVQLVRKYCPIFWGEHKYIRGKIIS